MHRKGRLKHGLTLQPGAELVFERDGSVRGRRVLEGDKRNWERDAYVIGTPYPGFPSVECFTSQVTFIEQDLVRVTLDYIGLSSDPTPYEVELIGSVGEEPIESHPNFSDFAGTASTPKPGAVFDSETGEFLAFTQDAGDGLAGVRGYLSPSVVIRRTYWTYNTPRANAIGSIAGYFGDIILPAGVGNFLATGFSYRQLGRAYQVTEEYTGSGRRGWSQRIYS